MAAFTPETFARTLLAESLFFDDETGALGTVALVSPEREREEFIAAFQPEEEPPYFLIERATEWEEADPEVGYALAEDAEDYGEYATSLEAAEALLALAVEHDLLPSFTLLLEEEL